jgi:hypothetical protein
MRLTDIEIKKREDELGHRDLSSTGFSLWGLYLQGRNSTG